MRLSTAVIDRINLVANNIQTRRVGAGLRLVIYVNNFSPQLASATAGVFVNGIVLGDNILEHSIQICVLIRTCLLDFNKS